MAIGDDFSIDDANGNIRHVSGSTTYTVLELHRWLQDLADDAAQSGNDEVDILSDNPSIRRTDQIIELQGSYNIDDDASEYLYGGSISQANGDTLYSGLQVIGSVNSGTTQLQIVQNNALMTNYWTTGLNNDATQNILLRILVKTRTGAADVDGKRIRVQAREWGDTYAFFNVTLGQGEGVAAIQTLADDFNQTAIGTIAGYTNITNTEGYQTIDLNNGNGAQPYYHQWDNDTQTLNDLYERAKWLVRRGTSSTLHGINGELFQGISHSFSYDNEASGPFQEDEILTFGNGATGILLALNDQGATGTMYIQLQTGVAPADNDTITGGTSSATADINGTVTARVISPVFIGTYTGNISTAYGVGVIPGSLTANDTLRDLNDVAQTPPNNVTVTINGLVSTEDYVFVARDDGSGGVDLDEYSLASGNNSGNGTLVVNETISSDTPASGNLRVYNGSSYDKYAYTSFTGSTFTLSGTLSQNYTLNDNCFVPFIDVLADATSESNTLVFSSNINVVIRVRDGGSTPIVPFETTGTIGSGGLTVTAIRTSDA